ncbi:TRAP transporter substrate-binding protein DctP [Lysinibacillus sp. NPDC097287]|uniref:TRAP transporter substrate-binding protein DctP n=1 Tax=Lysinibacillus sp. NPDC097287 TaxID=3364144 RepID=UPI00381790AB
MKKKFILSVLFGLLLLVIAACGSTKAGESEKSKETITLKLAIYQPTTHPFVTETIMPFMEKVTEETDGQVQFDFYPAEQLGKAADLLDLTSNGVADISVYLATYHPTQMPVGNPLLGIPGLYLKAYEGSMAYHELNKTSPVLESDFLSNGVRPIISFALPASEIFTNGKEIKVPMDLKGLKVRVSQEIQNDVVAALNATPMNLTVSDIYEGFERNVYDTIVANPSSIGDYGLDELAKYGTIGAHFGGLGTGLIINEKVYQYLPVNVQEILTRVGDELTASNAKFYDERTENIIQGYEENGIKMHELSADEAAQWQKFYDEVEKNWLKEKANPDLKEAIETFRKEVEKYQ